MADHDERNISPWVCRHAGRIAPGSDILDLACGSGRHARFLADRGHRVTAVDTDLAGVGDLITDDRFELLEEASDPPEPPPTR